MVTRTRLCGDARNCTAIHRRDQGQRCSSFKNLVEGWTRRRSHTAAAPGTDLAKGQACTYRGRNEFIAARKVGNGIAAQALSSASTTLGERNKSTVAAHATNLATFTAILVAGAAASLVRSVQSEAA
jgi:hypothetical protein